METRTPNQVPTVAGTANASPAEGVPVLRRRVARRRQRAAPLAPEPAVTATDATAGRSVEAEQPPQEAASRPAPTPAATAALQTLSMVVAPATVLTGLMYYFGWLYARTFTLGVGIDPDVLDYSTEDYLLRSVDLLFVPLAVLCVLLLALRWLHVQITARVSASARAERLSRLVLVLAVVGVLLTIPATAAVFRPAGVEIAGFHVGHAQWVPRWALPVGFVLGVALVDYAVQLRQRLGATSAPAAPTAWTTASQRAAIGGLMLLGLFWAVTVYAQDVGQMRVSALRQDPAAWQAFPAVVVYSAQDLVLDAPGVAVGRCPAAESAYRFRYTGLRLFAYANDRYFLLPATWPETGGPATVISDGDELRVEFLPGRAAPDPTGGCPEG